MKRGSPITILVTEDDEDDIFLISEAFEDAKLVNPIQYVRDGEELIQYLNNEGKYSDIVNYGRPEMILLDLNMPKIDGREALQYIKSNDNFKTIPIVVLSTSKLEEDIITSYNLRVNSFITKPVTFEKLVETIQVFSRYWFEIVELPSE